MKKPGKQFEADFKASVPEGWYYYRLKDGTASWNRDEAAAQAQEVRFQAKNDFDCLLYAYPRLYCIELKSCMGSFPFKGLRKNQVRGLCRADACKGVSGLVIINYRQYGVTVAINIERLCGHINTSTKASINYKEAQAIGLVIPQEQKRVHWRYDLRALTTGTAGV
jgi:recombination protein U